VAAVGKQNRSKNLHLGQLDPGQPAFRLGFD